MTKKKTTKKKKKKKKKKTNEMKKIQTCTNIDSNKLISGRMVK